MFFHATTDLSYLAAEPDGTSNYLLEFVDSGGKKATAYAASVGGGESLGDELLSDPNFANWTGGVPDGWVQSGTTSPGVRFIEQNANGLRIVSDGALIGIGSETAVITVGSLFLVKGTLHSRTIGNVYFGVTSVPTQQKTINTHGQEISVNISGTWSLDQKLVFARNAAPTDVVISSSSVKKYLDVPATGLKLVTTQNGSTRGMTSVETGFDSNRIVKIRFLDPDV